MNKRRIKENIDQFMFRTYNSLSNLKFAFRSRDMKKTLALNSNLLNKHKGERCIILGNGPSLKRVNSEKLKNEHVFAVNYYINNELFKEIIPEYYCIIDPLFFRNKNISEDLVNILKSTEQSTFFLSYEGKKIIDKYDIKNKIFYTYSNRIFTESFKQKIDLCGCLPAAHNVIVYCIMAAIYMGFSSIYLLGCDFSSFCTQKPLHSYEDSKNQKGITLEFELKAYSEVCYQHRILNSYAKENGVNIFNATPNSLLDVYPRIYSEVYHESRENL